MILTKTCSKCKKEKPFSDFNKGSDKYGLHVWCRDCYIAWARAHYKKNKEKIDEKHRKYHREHREERRAYNKEYNNRPEVKQHRLEYTKANREHIREYQKLYRLRNREQIRKKENEYYHKNKEKNKRWHKEWRDSHKDEIRKSSKRYREENRAKINQSHIERLHNDPIYKMKEQTRNMLRYVFRSKGHRKSSKTTEILGCDLDFFCQYLFSTWKDNYGTEWNGEPYHIDHIIPLATAKTEEDIIRLCHYTNLQMLTPEDNMTKSDKT